MMGLRTRTTRLTFAFACSCAVVVLMTFSDATVAQQSFPQGHATSAQPPKATTLDKLKSLHNRIKQKLSRPERAPTDPRLEPAASVSRPNTYPQYRRPLPAAGTSSFAARQPEPFARTSSAGRRDHSPTQLAQYEQVREVPADPQSMGGRIPGYDRPANLGNPTQWPQPVQPQSRATYGQGRPEYQEPLPPPAGSTSRNDPAPPQVEMNYPAEAYRAQPNSYLDGQMLASERAIKLEKENTKLRNEIRIANERIAGLRRELEDKTRLMSEIDEQISDSIRELQAAQQVNAELLQTIEQLKVEKRNQQIKSAELLEGIRRNLDNVLAKEISDSKQ